MECNKDDAIRAKEISERHIVAKDYLGAKKFAVKAQTLYPDLDGIQRMLATIDVYISSEKINGVTDWYKILNIDPKADEDTIKKQYRKLALVLHPDKNKSVGADGAFNLITEASNLLSDKDKRLEFDQIRSSKKGVKKVNTQTGVKRKSRAANGTPYQPNYSITPNFWTVCHRCKLQHQYPREFLHRNIRCFYCRMPYYAFEYPPPVFQFPQMPPHVNHFPPRQPDSVPGVSHPSPSKTGEKAKKEREADLKRKISELDLKATKKTKVAEVPAEQNKKSGKDKITKPPKSSKDVSNYEKPKMALENTARERIRKQLNDWERIAMENGNGNESKKANQKTSEPVSIPVPDSDFHDFDKDRLEICFDKDQVWAAYDDDDGMPRNYAIIHEVVSVKPFKVSISWLNLKTSSGSGFTKTCGEFVFGQKIISKALNSFSHKLRWTKGEEEGVLSVFPKKGDVWALYKNWSPKWNKLTKDEVKHVYDMVEVIEDYDENLGVKISPLIKVAGFSTVFHRDEMVIKVIPKEELVRFSHQVPSFLLSGQEGENIPEGCRELDPAATPLELLQVI